MTTDNDRHDPTAKPTVFIASSSEALNTVNRLVGLMRPYFQPRPWNSVFAAGEYIFDTLMRGVPR